MMEDQRFRAKVSQIEVELKALEMTQMRVVAAEGKRRDNKPDPASSILKIKGSEIQQNITDLLMEVVGPFALPFTDEDDAGSNELPIAPDYAGPLAPIYFNYRKVSIYGGSNEIQKNIIAKAILGL
jgi:alkylation response protein AidB-like acyl-CoA dehydrogenase